LGAVLSWGCGSCAEGSVDFRNTAGAARACADRDNSSSGGRVDSDDRGIGGGNAGRVGDD
jgi:hypothetical protein